MMLLCVWSAGANAVAPPEGAPVVAAAGVPLPTMTVPSYKDVIVTGGPLGDQLAIARRFLLDLSDDNLLHGFRTRAGLAAPGWAMGGWYDPEDFAGAHTFGQFISALARMSANIRDPAQAQACREKVARLVHGFRETIAGDGFFYSSQKACKDWGCYIYDKNCTAMRDAATLAGCTEALEVLRTMTDWAQKNLPPRNDEWYTLPANLYACHALTGEERYLELARRYDYSADFYDTFAAGGDGFRTDRHAYSHVNALLSATSAFKATGAPRYRVAAIRAWNLLTTTQSYASGGWGGGKAGERFVIPGKLADTLTATHNHFETSCGTYATVNLDRELLSLTGESKYADNAERLIFNGMLACLPPEADGRAFYYSDYSPGATKTFFRERWSCCAGTYGLNCADYPLDIYANTPEGPAVLFFVPSRLGFDVGGANLSLEQATDFPRSGHTSITVHCPQPTRFTLSVRVPGWAGAAKPAVRLPAGDLATPPEAKDGWLRIAREWKDGDAISIDFPMSLRCEPIDAEHPRLAAVMYGPLMLVALAAGEVQLPYDPQAPHAWLSPVLGRELTFRTRPAAEGTTPKPTPENPVTFVPFYKIAGERYTTYVRFADANGLPRESGGR